MPIIRKTLNTLTLITAGGIAFWHLRTRNSKFVPVSSTDEIFSSPGYLRNNPHKNPLTHDLCVRRVPIGKVKPHLLEKAQDGKLVEGFCAGIFGGLGYMYQRSYLAKKYQNDTTTAHQLWSRPELKSSTYDVGTQITDHFEVIEKTPEHITIRCGDSPLNTGVRESDGLFEMGAKILREEGVVEFSLKSVFYKGLGKVEGTEGPMPPHVEFAHRLYTKLWMETAIRNVML